MLFMFCLFFYSCLLNLDSDFSPSTCGTVNLALTLACLYILSANCLLDIIKSYQLCQSMPFLVFLPQNVDVTDLIVRVATLEMIMAESYVGK